MKNKPKPTLLIHICCAPDVIFSLPLLRREYKVVGYFFNPNIFPKEEYIKRLNEVKKLSQLQKWQLIEGKYDQKKWFSLIRGYENEPEEGKRCEICIGHSLLETARKAKELGFDCFTTTLTNSPKKRIEMITKLGFQIEKKINIKYLETNFKKNNGYLKSVRMSKKLNIYRQSYCGCKYSK
jgi:predicted adenine nucleotide alpha hydrolase (AANH) superfamily ATPase